MVHSQYTVKVHSQAYCMYDDYLAMCYANTYHIVDTVNVSL